MTPPLDDVCRQRACHGDAPLASLARCRNMVAGAGGFAGAEKRLRPENPDPAASDVLQTLFAAAAAARRHAYAPYSRFRVGAAVLSGEGAVHAGCNVENAAYPVGICAEAAAVAAMVSAGGTRLRAVLVLGGGPQLVTPCGACRQRLREFASGDLPIHCADETGIRQSWRLDALLPAAFGPDNLPVSSQGPARP